MAERWYEFTQVETLERPLYVKASSLKEARQKRTQGVADYSPTFPDLEIRDDERLASTLADIYREDE